MNDVAKINSSSNRAIKLKNEIARWMEMLKREYRPDKVILFGSYAQDRVNEWSDVDMVVVKETNKRFLDRSKEILLLLSPNVGLDVLVYTPAEFKNLSETRLFFKQEILLKGLIAYEK